MDKDTDPQFVAGGNFVDAFAVRQISTDEGGSVSVEDMLGNRYGFQLPQIEARGKKYRVYLDFSAANQYVLEFKKTDGTALVATSTVTMTVGNGVSLTNFATEVGSVLTGEGLSFLIDPVQTDPNHGYVDIEITSFPGWEYYIESTGANDFTFVIVQEGIDAAMAGPLEAIGGYYILGNLFVWSTTGREEVKTIDADIINIFDNTAGVIRIETNIPHGLVDGQTVLISGAASNTGANGRWIAIVVSPYEFDLAMSFFTNASTAGGSISVHLEAVSQIGVAARDENTETWQYTPLAQTKRWGFRTVRQIQPYVEFENGRWSFYWVDHYNPDRAMYYDGDFVFFGAMSVNNAAGLYSFETIYEETVLTVANIDIKIEVEAVTDGGAVSSGNNRYSARTVSQSGSTSKWLPFTAPVNIYTTPIGSAPAEIIGDNEGVTTGKKVDLVVSGIPEGLYQYIEIANINYLNGAVKSFLIGRYPITGTTVRLSHTGNEADIQDLDLSSIGSVDAGYISSKSIDVLDNRLVRSNLTSNLVNDFTLFFKSFRHKLKRKELDSIGKSASAPVDSLWAVREYMDPMNTYRYGGYMMNETYRFNGKVQLINGSIIPTTFHIDDIRFDTDAVNTGNADGDNRRDLALLDYSVTDSGLTKVYIPYVEFDFDPEFVIDGVPARNLIRRIWIERVEMDAQYREVIASGYLMPFIGQDVLTGSSANFVMTPNAGTAPDHSGAAPLIRVIPANTATSPYPYIEYQHFDMNEGLTIPSNFEAFTNQVSGWTSGASTNKPTAQNQFASFYSPDLFLGQNSKVAFQPSDKMLCLDDQDHVFKSFIGVYGLGGGVAYKSDYREYSCVNGSQYLEKGIDEYLDCIDGATVTSTTTERCQKAFNVLWRSSPATTLYTETWTHRGSPVFRSAAKFTAQNGLVGTGWIYAQMYRNRGKGAKFGLTGSNKTIYTGAYIDITPASTGTKTIEVFGGDTFSSRTYFKYRYANNRVPAPSSGGCTPSEFCVNGFGMGLVLYSQNRINSNMRWKNSGSLDIFPDMSTVQWLEREELDPDAYNHGYDIRDEIYRSAEYDPVSRTMKTYPSRIAYSPKKPNNSLVDFYRDSLPADYKDLDLKNGEITHHAVGNGHLLVWQAYDFRREFFNSAGLLVSAGGPEVVVGDGSVMRGSGVQLSKYGCRHKWAIVKGVSQGGKDVFYWPNTETGQFIRFGGDGTVNLSVIKNMRTWTRKYLRWVDNAFTPAAGDGIHGIWSERTKEVIWTARGRRSVPLWENGVDYVAGSFIRVLDYEQQHRSFEQTGEIYECVQDHIGFSTQNKPDYGLNWTQYWVPVGHDDSRCYSEFTVVFSEIKNGWVMRKPPKPKIFLPWKDIYLSPRPIGNVNKIYEHESGELLVWYRDTDATAPDQVEQSDRGHIDMVINHDPNMNKRFCAYLFNTVLTPKRVEIRTSSNQYSYLDEADFELRFDQYAATVKNDATVTVQNPTGTNEADTSHMSGTYAVVRLYFEPRILQRLRNFIVKIIPRNRNYNT